MPNGKWIGDDGFHRLSVDQEPNIMEKTTLCVCITSTDLGGNLDEALSITGDD